MRNTLRRRGIRERSHLTTFFNVESVDPSAGVVSSLEGEQVGYDLLVLVPPHKGAEVVSDSGLGDGSGWLPTDRHTLAVEGQTRIFALGDATNLPISKSGSTAHFEAPAGASGGRYDDAGRSTGRDNAGPTMY